MPLTMAPCVQGGKKVFQTYILVDIKNKLAKFRRCVSRVHFAKFMEVIFRFMEVMPFRWVGSIDAYASKKS